MTVPNFMLLKLLKKNRTPLNDLVAGRVAVKAKLFCFVFVYVYT